MSHSSSAILYENVIEVKSGSKISRRKGYKKATSIKKGDKIKIVVETPEDGEFEKIVTVAGTKIVRDYTDVVEFQFEGCCYDINANIPVDWLYKMEV